MHLQELKSLESRLLEPLSIPVIGRCLQKKAVTALAEDNSYDAVKVLARAVTRLKDEEIKEIVLDTLGKIRNQRCIDAFSQVWADTRHRDLTNLLVWKGWVASAPIDIRVLSALKTKQLQVVTNGGKEIVEPLLKAFQDRDSEIANRASECAISFTNPEVIDYICQQWAETRDKLLEQLVCKGKYVAQQPIELSVLTALKVGNLKVIRDGGEEIVEPLLDAFQDKDAEIGNRASEYSTIFDQPEYQELLFRLVLEQNHPIARQVVIKAQYAPSEPNQRALFYFLTEQWNKYESLDYEHSLLQKVYEIGDEKLRKRIADKAREAGRVAWVQIVAGGRQGQRLEKMTDDEWETTLNVLNSGQQWEEMWRLAQKAPAIWSKELLQKLKQAAWLPQAEHERVGFERLKQLSEKCLEKIESMGRLMGCQATLRSRRGCLRGVRFSPDGKILAAYGKYITLWQMPDGKRITKLDTHYNYGDEVLQIVFSPNSKLLASCHSTQDRAGKTVKTIELWKIPHGEDEISLASLTSGYQQPLAIITDVGSLIKDIIFSPDGKLLASRGSNTIQLWQMPDGQPLATLTTDYNNWVTGITSITSFSPDGKILASCGGNGTIEKKIWLWKMHNGQPLASVIDCDGASGITFRPDGQVLASINPKETIRLWQIPDAQPITTLTGHTSLIPEITFSPDGQILASCEYGKDDVKLWSSDLPRLLNHPVEQLNQESREFIEKALQDDKVTQEEKHWLEFMQASMNWHQRFDVEVEDAPQLVSTGEFDIEIEG